MLPKNGCPPSSQSGSISADGAQKIGAQLNVSIPSELREEILNGFYWPNFLSDTSLSSDQISK
jgi:hypothetical protein